MDSSGQFAETFRAFFDCPLCGWIGETDAHYDPELTEPLSWVCPECAGDIRGELEPYDNDVEWTDHE